jgi:hypothetical protein
MERGGFLNHPPEIESLIFEGDEIRRSEFHEDRQLHDAIEGIFQIRSWARQAKALAVAGKAGDPTGSESLAYAGLQKGPDFKIEYEIFEIWKRVLEKKIRFSINFNTQEVSGPLIDFALCCLQLLGAKPQGAAAIRAHARRYMAKRDFQKT